MNYSDSRKQEMYDWFHQRFMEPEAGNFAEGGLDRHMHFCGEVYCAGEVIHSNFCGIFPDKIIDEVVKDLESECSKWVLRKIEAPPVCF
jgi:hypothetical protein